MINVSNIVINSAKNKHPLENEYKFKTCVKFNLKFC